MAKTTVKLNKSRLQSETINKIDRAIDATPLKNEVGEFAAERIRLEARRKRPLNNTGTFKDLKDLTIQQREYLEKYNATHPTYKKSRSNLTLTGQFLDSISFEIVPRGIELFFKGPRKGYRTGPKSRQKRPPTNAQLAEYLADIGFVVFTKKGIEQNQKFQNNVLRIIRKFLRRQLRRQ